MPTIDEAVDGVLGAQEPAKKNDPIASAVDAVLAGEQSARRGVLYDALRVNPDQAAKAKQLERETGVPADVGLRNLADVELRRNLERITGMTDRQASDTFRRYMTRSEFMRMSHDDVDALMGIDQQIKGPTIGPINIEPTAGSVLSGLAQSPVQGFRAAREGMRMQMSDFLESVGLLTLDPVDKANQMRKLAQASGASEFTTPTFDTGLARGVYGGLSSTLRAAPGVALSVMSRNPTPALASMGLQTQAESYAKYRTRGGAPGESFVGATAEGGIEVATEMLPTKFLTEALGKKGFGEFLTGMLAREIPGEQVATLLQDAVDTAVANPNKTWGEYLNERPGAAFETLVATITQGAVMGGINAGLVRLARDQQSLEQSDRDTKTFEALAALAAQSKLRERDPQTFAQFVQDAAEDADNAPKHVYVDAKVMADVLNQMGISDEQLAQIMPSVPAQIAGAFEANATVEIPIGEALAVAPGTPLEKVLMQNARMTPDGLSRAEVDDAAKQAEQFIGQEVGRLMQQAAQTEKAEAEVETIRQTMRDQLKAVGRFSADVNDGYSRLVGAFYSTMAQRLGVTPTELYARFPLRVTGETKAGGLDQTKPVKLYHGTTPEAAKAIEAGGFDLSKSADGSVWFTSNPDIGEVAATGKGGIVSRTFNEGELKLGGWEEADKYSTDELIAQGYDGLRLEDDGEITYQIFKPEKLRPQTLAQSPADQRDLIVTHNLTAANLLHAVKMGGIAVPSLAITKKDTPLTGFGEITLIGDSNLADPKGYAGTKVFGADIYSPRYPSVTFEFKPAQRKQGEAALRPAMEAVGQNYLEWSEVEREGPREIERNAAFLWKFLTDKGLTPEVKRTEVKPLPPEMMAFAEGKLDRFDLMRDEAFIDAAWKMRRDFLLTRNEGNEAETDAELAEERARVKERGQFFYANDLARQLENYRRDLRDNGKIDREATRRALQNQVREADLSGELEAAARQFVQDLAPNERIFQGFTPSGNRKYIPHTLENVVKILKKELRGGESFNYGVGSLRAKFTPEFKSLAAIRKEKGRLVSAEQFAPVKEEVDAELAAIATDLGLSLDQTIEVFEDAPKMGVERAIGRALKDYGSSALVDEETKLRVGDFLTKLRNLPTAYFEAKILRDVSLSEFKAAVVPEGTDQAVIDALRAAGVNEIRTYAKGDETDRAAKIKENEALFFQGSALATYSPEQILIALGPDANYSSFLHELGHFWLEALGDMASQPGAPQQIVDDFNTTMRWFGVEPGAWSTMTLDQKRAYHERWAESVEQYLFEGKAPSVELQPLFRRFTSWMKEAYKKLIAPWVREKDNPVQLSDEIRRVMDRLIATDQQIAEAEEVAGMLPEFEATNEAIEKLQARSLANLKWMPRARDEYIRKLQRQAKELRTALRKEAYREVMGDPTMRAWAWLTRRVPDSDKVRKVKEASSKGVDPAKDSLLTAIAKMGGLDRDSAARLLGVHPDNFNHASGVFGKPVFRKSGGVDADTMGEMLAEVGYLMPSEDGRYDLRQLEEFIDDEINGTPHYSIAKEYGEAQPGEGVDIEQLAAGRFDFGSLVEMGVPTQDAQRLADRGMTSRSIGMHPDLIADAFGFESGTALVEALLAAQSPAETIEGMTDRRMLERHGDLIDSRAIEQAASEAIHNEARARALAAELKAQSEAMNPRRDTGQTGARGQRITVNALAEAMRQFAQRLTDKVQVGKLRSHTAQHRAAEARAGKAWQEFTAKGDTKEAVQSKRDQALNNYTVRAMQDAQAEVKKIAEFFARVTKGNDEKTVERGRDPDVVNAMRAILALHGVSPSLGKGALDYLRAVEANDPDMANVLRPGVEAALSNPKPVKEMTVAELRDLYEELRAMWDLAKRSRQMEVDGNLIDLEEAEADLVERMTEKGIPDTVPGEGQAVTQAEERKLSLSFAKAALTRVEQWAEAMDGKFGGPFLRLVFQPIKQAADRYRTQRAEYRTKFTALLENIAPLLPPGEIQAPELGYKFGGGRDSGVAELLHAILHTGNDSNKRKLLLGRTGKGGPNDGKTWATENPDGTLDTSRWDAFIARMVNEGKLQPAHYEFVQAVWDLLDELKPGAQQAHRAVYGRYFNEVTANAFTDPWGQTHRGGYVPAMVDAKQNTDADIRAAREAENESMALAFPTTPTGFTKSRVEYNRPLMLDLRTLAQHMDKVILFTHLQPAVNDVRRLVSRKGVAYGLSRMNPAAYKGLLIPWLNRAAKQSVETPISGDGKLSRFASAMRARAGLALMFGNVSNTLQQITGFSLAAVKVRPALMLEATARYTASPKAMLRNVVEMSPYMRDRMLNETSAMTDVANELLMNANVYDKAQAWTQRHGYFLQTAFDKVMSPIIWTAAYNQAIEQQMTEAQAIQFADGTIRQTQGTTLPEDVSRFETGPAYGRLFTQFINYFNMMANTNALAFKQITEQGMGVKKGAGRALYIALTGVLLPIWIAEAIAIAFRGGPDDEDKDGEYLDDWLMAVFGMGTARGLLAQVPLLGMAAQKVLTSFNDNPADDKFSLSPAVSLLESAAMSPASVYKAIADEGDARKAIRDVAAAATMVTGMPFYAAARPLGYAAGVAQDKIEPTGPVDLTRGLVTGTPSKESKQ
jgi:hypothetical protein